MTRRMKRTVQTAKTGRHSDGDGLHLVVGENGRKKWVLRYQVRGVRRDKGLGSYPEIGLKEARSRAGADRGLIAKGVDPIEEQRAARKTSKPVPTFGDIAQLVIADAQGKSTNAKVRYQWERGHPRAVWRPRRLVWVLGFDQLDPGGDVYAIGAPFYSGPHVTLSAILPSCNNYAWR